VIVIMGSVIILSVMTSYNLQNYNCKEFYFSHRRLRWSTWQESHQLSSRCCRQRIYRDGSRIFGFRLSRRTHSLIRKARVSAARPLKFWRNSMDANNLKSVMDALKITNIYSYLETSGGQSSNPYLNVVHFLNTRAD